jgi:hypothetical protein
MTALSVFFISAPFTYRGIISNEKLIFTSPSTIPQFSKENNLRKEIVNFTAIEENIQE